MNLADLSCAVVVPTERGPYQKKGKPFFPEGARCRIVPRARAPQLAAPVASQVATTGGSGRRPLSERSPSRSLGQVLCTGRVSSHRTGLAAGGLPQVVLGPRGELHRAPSAAADLYALAGSGLRPAIGCSSPDGTGSPSSLGLVAAPSAPWSIGRQIDPIRGGGGAIAAQLVTQRPPPCCVEAGPSGSKGGQTRLLD